jgi:hypothetical protein
MSAPYRSYLLRLWLEPNNPPAWRAILESPINGERHGFANLNDLFAFLNQETNRLEKDKNLTQGCKDAGMQRN